MLRKFRPAPRRSRTPASLTAVFWQHFFEANSLTATLKQAARHSFRVRVQDQRLVMQQRAYTWQRRVCLLVDDVVWIEATVSIPLATLKPSAKHVLHLKNKPIGEWLFRDPCLQRSAFSLHWQTYQNGSIPQRHCRLRYRGSDIVLSESFYPAAIDYFSSKVQDEH